MLSSIGERIKMLKMSSTIFSSMSCSAPPLNPPTPQELQTAFHTLSSPRLTKTCDEYLSVRPQDIFLLTRKGHRILSVCSLGLVIERMV